MIIQSKLVAEKLSVKDAISFLEKRGYCVKKLDYGETTKVTNSELVDQFYNLLATVEGDEYVLTLPTHTAQDYEALKRFQEKGKSLGLTKAAVNLQLSGMLKTLFNNYTNLGLNVPLSSFAWILSSGGIWIINKANLLNKKRIREFSESAEFGRYLDAACDGGDNSSIRELAEKRHEELFKYLEDEG